MIDGKPYKTLRRHLSTHGLTPEEYRARYNPEIGLSDGRAELFRAPPRDGYEDRARLEGACGEGQIDRRFHAHGSEARTTQKEPTQPE